MMIHVTETRCSYNVQLCIIIIIMIWLYSPIRALASPKNWGFVTITFLRGCIVSPAPNPNLEDQASVFMTPGDRVAQLYPQALGTHFNRLLRHAWVTVGLFFNLGYHTGPVMYTNYYNLYIFMFILSSVHLLLDFV
jgi:hypothetical protein